MVNRGISFTGQINYTNTCTGDEPEVGSLAAGDSLALAIDGTTVTKLYYGDAADADLSLSCDGSTVKVSMVGCAFVLITFDLSPVPC